jgi:hypothetical protein
MNSWVTAFPYYTGFQLKTPLLSQRRVNVKLGAHWIGSDRIGPARFSPARIRRTSAHCFGTYRRQKPVTADKHIKPFAWKQVLAFRTLRNVLLCPVFRNCSDTCRRSLCRSEPCRSSARPALSSLSGTFTRCFDARCVLWLSGRLL